MAGPIWPALAILRLSCIVVRVWNSEHSLLAAYSRAADALIKPILDTMQTRSDLYDFLGYHNYENKLDALFADETTNEREAS